MCRDAGYYASSVHSLSRPHLASFSFRLCSDIIRPPDVRTVVHVDPHRFQGAFHSAGFPTLEDIGAFMHDRTDQESECIECRTYKR